MSLAPLRRRGRGRDDDIDSSWMPERSTSRPPSAASPRMPVLLYSVLTSLCVSVSLSFHRASGGLECREGADTDTGTGRNLLKAKWVGGGSV